MSQVTRWIVQESHDEPHLEDRRITVQFIKTQIEDRGLEPRTVADRHDIDVADVYARGWQRRSEMSQDLDQSDIFLEYVSRN